jgi:hypothetical protein
VVLSEALPPSSWIRQIKLNVEIEELSLVDVSGSLIALHPSHVLHLVDFIAYFDGVALCRCLFGLLYDILYISLLIHVVLEMGDLLLLLLCLISQVLNFASELLYLTQTLLKVSAHILILLCLIFNNLILLLVFLLQRHNHLLERLNVCQVCFLL